jgi:phage protein D
MSKKVPLKSVRENRYYWKVVFPTVNITTSYTLLAGELIQNEHSHDIFIIKIKGNLKDRSRLTAGDPVELYWGINNKNSEWKGYVHSVEKQTELTTTYTRIICVGMSFYMKNENQRVMTNVTADRFARKIAKHHKLKAKTSKHPRIFPMISQSGQSDWQMLVRLAAQCGYAFRVENGYLIFKSYKELYKESKRNAPYFRYIDTPNISLTPMMSVFHFRPLLSEKGPELDGASLNRTLNSMNRKGVFKKAKYKPKYKKYKISDQSVSRYVSENPDPIFNKVITDEVSYSTSFSKNVLSSMAIDQGYRYQARANLLGDPHIRPYNVIYLDGLPDGTKGYWVVMGVNHKFGGSKSYEMEVIVGSEFMNEEYVEGKKSNTRDLTVTDPDVTTKPVTYTLENSNVVSKMGREIEPDKKAYTGNPLDFYGIDYSTEMYKYFPPNFSQYPDTPRWRIT